MSTRLKTQTEADEIAASEFDVSSSAESEQPKPAPASKVAKPAVASAGAARKAAPAPAPAPTSTEDKIEDLRRLFAELTAMDNRPDVETLTRAEQSAHREKRAALAKRIYRLQQGPEAPTLDANAMAAVKNAEKTSHKARESMLARLKKKISTR